MKTAIIIHGMPEKEEYDKFPEQSQMHWLPWLANELESKKIVTAIPDMPTPYAPVYEQWRDTFERSTVDENTILVGHSGGAGFLLRWLSENDVKADKLILVAPWIDPDGIDREHMTDFFDFKIDSNIREKTTKITIFISRDDEVPMLRTVEELRKNLSNIKIIEKTNAGHFTTEDGYSEFQELLEEVLK